MDDVRQQGLSRRAWLAAGLMATLGNTATAVRAAAASTDSAFLLAQAWTPGRSPVGFLVSEKLDGVRARWDGQQLWLRSGLPLSAPASFLAGLPADQALDGELWLGRGQFDATSALLRRATPEAHAWAPLRYMLFELPGAEGRFAQRYAQLQALVAQRRVAPWVQVLEQRSVADAPALAQWLADVVASGGEGLMLHWADAPYLSGRQSVLAKYKPVQDAEAVVLAHLPGRGRLAGKVGALQVRNEQGQVFRVGSGLDDALREAPPPVGSRITYAWRGQTASGLPRFATLVRVRPQGF